MTDNVYIYMQPLPSGLKSFATPCSDGYTVYIDPRLDREAQLRAYEHELEHIENGDFEKTTPQKIEVEVHNKF